MLTRTLKTFTLATAIVWSSLAVSALESRPRAEVRSVMAAARAGVSFARRAREDVCRELPSAGPAAVPATSCADPAGGTP
jgi:hypothetical protein